MVWPTEKGIRQLYRHKENTSLPTRPGLRHTRIRQNWAASQRHYSILETSSLVSFPLARPWSVDLSPVRGFSAKNRPDVQVARSEVSASSVPRPWRPAHQNRVLLQSHNIYVQLGWRSRVYYRVFGGIPSGNARMAHHVIGDLDTVVFAAGLYLL